MYSKGLCVLTLCVCCALFGAGCSSQPEPVGEAPAPPTDTPAVEAPAAETPAEQAAPEEVPAEEATAALETVAAETPADEKPAAQVIGDIGPWKLADFARSGNVRADGDAIIIERGNDMSGIVYTGEIPRMNYEIRIEAKRVEGSDFFCGLAFPYGDTSCSFVCGGWGGTVTGLSSIDYYDASENQTGGYFDFEKDRWYRIRVQVTEAEIHCWIDDEEVVSLQTDGHKIGIRWEMEACLPLGIATWQTTGAIRGFMIRELP